MIAKIDPSDILWIIVTIAVLLVVATIAMIVVKRRFSGGSYDAPPVAFTLEDLRKMRDNEEITEEEYTVLKDKIIQQNRLS